MGGYSYSYLRSNYLIEVDGKFGKVNYQNLKLISPKYDKLYTVGYSEMSVGMKDGEWHLIVDSNETTVHSFIADEWVSVRSIEDKSYALIVRNDSLLFKDLDGFKEYYGLDLFKKKYKQRTVYSAEGFTGVVNDQGEIILPFDYDWITIHDYKTEHPYITASKNQLFGMYTIEGQIRNEHIYEKISCICQGGETYFKIQKQGRYAVAKRNDEGKLISITDFVFASISCYSSAEGGPFATGYYEDYTEPTTYIYADGRIETEE